MIPFIIIFYIILIALILLVCNISMKKTYISVLSIILGIVGIGMLAERVICTIISCN
jgi:hypothetical protein